MLNAKIIDQFNLLIKQITAEYLNAQSENQPKETTMHKFRLSTVKKIVNILKSLPFVITKPSDLVGIPGIGKGTIARVDEILRTGTLAELKDKYPKPKQIKIDQIQALEKVIGIGKVTARKLVTEHNIRSIPQLEAAIKKGKIKVSPKVILGLKYFGVVEDKIPRRETEVTRDFLQKEAKKIDPNLELMICGSYRRGKPTSGDVDVLMYNSTIHRDDTESVEKSESLLAKYIDKLTTDGFLLDHMTDKNYSVKYMGFSKYKGYPVRRIDIRFVPFESLPTAMLYFTGPYELNSIMRNAAKKRKMKLNEYGLYKIEADGTETPIAIESEADVFEILGMDYLTPAEREAYSSGTVGVKV